MGSGTTPGPARRLRVALDATPMLGHPTGVGVFCQGALQALSERDDLDVSAYAVSWLRRDVVAAHVPAKVRVQQRPMPARPLHAAWKRGSTPKVEWFFGKVDVVHGTNFVVPPTKHAGTVVTVHDLTPLHFPELCTPATLAYPDLIRRALRRGAWVHTVSDFVASEVVDAFEVDPSRVVTVAHGVPELPSVSLGEAGRLVERYLPDGAARYILAVGTAEPRKDLPGLVRAFDQLASRSGHDDLVLLLAGQPGWGDDALTAAIDHAQAAKRIIRTGWVDDVTLSALLSQAAVLAYPSLYEGFGFPPLQAMVAGAPVVATRAGAIPEVVGDAAVLTAVGDTDGLAGALDQVLTDAELRARLIAAGTARAATFSWDRCGEGLAHLYRRIAGDRRD